MNTTKKGEQLVRDFIKKSAWRFAKKMPKWPHWYSVREWCNPQEFQWFVRYIRKHGIPKKFFKARHIYYEIDGFRYWTMGAPVKETIIINRAVGVPVDIGPWSLAGAVAGPEA